MIQFGIMELKHVKTIGQLREVYKWCEETFGPTKTSGGTDRWIGGHWIGGRWHLDELYSFKFSHSQDAMLFKLKWL